MQQIRSNPMSQTHPHCLKEAYFTGRASAAHGGETHQVEACQATTTDAGHPDTGQNRHELRAVIPLPGGDHDRQRLLTLLTGQMHLRGQPAP